MPSRSRATGAMRCILAAWAISMSDRAMVRILFWASDSPRPGERPALTEVKGKPTTSVKPGPQLLARMRAVHAVAHAGPRRGHLDEGEHLVGAAGAGRGAAPGLGAPRDLRLARLGRAPRGGAQVGGERGVGEPLAR